jgi:hypothetical protein
MATLMFIVVMTFPLLVIGVFLFHAKTLQDIRIAVSSQGIQVVDSRTNNYSSDTYGYMFCSWSLLTG